MSGGYGSSGVAADGGDRDEVKHNKRKRCQVIMPFSSNIERDQRERKRERETKKRQVA